MAHPKPSRAIAYSLVVLLGCMVARGYAQQNEAATGSVSGHVIAQDTARPVRFAQVMLQSVAAVSGDGNEERRFGGGAGTRTDADGNFYVASVAPGDYYVTANTPGYIPERTLLQAAVNAGADPATLLARVPVVHVAAGELSSVTVTIERGGTISGKIQWEDGSPAAGVNITAVSTAKPSASQYGPLQNFQSASGGIFATSDDRGVYRIAGLTPGEYLVRSQIQSSPVAGSARAYTPPIRVYAPGVFHKADAKTVTVKAGEERSDVAMTIDLRDLRSVSGHASSATSGQAVASGRVALVDPNDNDLQLGGTVAANGDFVVRYVPRGNYTLKIIGASSQPASGRGRDSDSGHGVSFQAFSQAEVVTDADLSGVEVTLTPVTSQPGAQ